RKPLAIKAQSPFQPLCDVTWRETQVTENGLSELALTPSAPRQRGRARLRSHFPRIHSNGGATMRVVGAVSLQAIAEEIKLHKLEPVDGQYHHPEGLSAEAATIEGGVGRKQPGPSEVQDIVEGKVPGWKTVDALDDLM